MRGRLHRQQALANARVVHLDENAVLEIYGAEQVGVRKQHLRFSEKQQTVLVQREMKAGDDARLRLGVEVHQRVAADEQIEPRYRRIMNEIETTEDHRAAQLRFHRELIGVRALEIFFSKLCRHGGHRFGVVDAVPRLRQRIVVDVGGVDFHPLAERLRTGFANAGSVYTGNGPRVTVLGAPGGTSQNAVPAGLDRFGVGLTVGVLIDP